MKTKVDLSKYEDMYDSFDKGHQRDHMEGVRTFAVKLARKYCPDKLEVVYVSATLHDIGLTLGRKDHEISGCKIVKEDDEIRSAYSEEEYSLILEGIREHRASTGKPKSIVAKIIKDSDKAYADMYTNFRRAYDYNREKDSQADHKEILRRAALYFDRNFKKDGNATNTFFEESRKQIIGCYQPIIDAYQEDNIQRLEEILNHK